VVLLLRLLLLVLLVLLLVLLVLLQLLPAAGRLACVTASARLGSCGCSTYRQYRQHNSRRCSAGSLHWCWC
jgi:hypothetical protein